jgi:hypothetical protein
MKPAVKTLLIGVVSLATYSAVVVVGDSFSAASSFRDGLSHALFFGPLFVVVTFPILVGFGFGLRWVIERLIRRPLPFRSIIPFAVLVPVSLSMLSSAIPDSPKTVFRRFVADDVPESLSGLQFWKRSGFGNSTVIVKFKLNPEDFGKVISRYAYSEEELTSGHWIHPIDDLIRHNVAFPIQPSTKPASSVFRASRTLSNGARESVSHYVNEARDEVLTVRVLD